jgi:DNA-directed RNA polymerase III subunit RPC7
LRRQNRQASQISLSSFFICLFPFSFSPELERYSDKYRPSAMSQPTLKRKDLHAPFFPPEVFEDYFNPKRNKKGRVHLTFFCCYNYSLAISVLASRVGPRRVKLNLEELDDEGEEVFN